MKIWGCLVLLSLATIAESFVKVKCRGTWSEWGGWNRNCENDCSGYRVRKRECVNNGLFYCGTPKCAGSRKQKEKCGGEVTHGGWSDWSVPECRYCSQKRLRSRTCNSPAPRCGGGTCVGQAWEMVKCGTEGCPALEGNVVVQSIDNSCGATVKVSCPQCHELEGAANLRCLPDGRWNRNPPTCNQMDGIEAQWSAFGPWDSHCVACNQIIARKRNCQSVCGEICKGDPEEAYICGSAGCSINAFVHRSNELVASRETAVCGETVTLRCRSADKVLEGASELRCGLGGWEGPLPNCVAESCPAIESLPNGKVISTGLTYGKFAQFSCDDGYELEGQQYLVCLGSAWSYEVPSCIQSVRSCPSLEYQEHLVTNTTNAAEGTVIEVSCAKGYALDGLDTAVCLEGGVWNETPSCHQLTCPAFPEIDNALAVHTDSGRRVEVTCDQGFTLHGVSILQCVNTGDWDQPYPTCQRTICQLPVSEHGEWYRVADHNIALLRCDKGFETRGAQELLCGEDGEWVSGEAGECVPRNCPSLPRIQNGVLSTKKREVGSTVLVTCSEGFVSSGHWQLSCLSSGEWDHPLPVCRRSACSSLPRILNGFVSSQRFESGSLVDVMCEPGFRLVGQSSLQCLPSGDWSSAMPRCDLFACVTQPIANGRASSDVVPLRKSATIICDEGYTLEGSNTVVCSPTGEILTHPDTRCVPVTCPLFSVPHGDVATDDVIVGSTARVTCHAGYRGNGEATCLKDGSWDSHVTCELVTCAPYPVLYKGYVEGEGNIVGSTADLICEIGFCPSSVDSITCLQDGSWRDTEQLACVPNGCAAVGRPQNGMFISLPGAYVQLLCNAGYKVAGGSHVLSCSASGQWNSTIPHCALDVQCPALAPPYAGSLSTNITEYRTEVSVSCSDGHILSDPSPIYCNSSGLWNATLPSCSFPDCPDVSGNGITITGTSVGDTASLECGSCESRQGNRHSVCASGGQWDPPIGTCGTVYCTTRINRRLYQSVEGSIPTKCGKSVSFVCKPGYTTIGRTTITCYDTGQYDYHVPFCVESGIFRVRRHRRK